MRRVHTRRGRFGVAGTAIALCLVASAIMASAASASTAVVTQVQWFGTPSGPTVSITGNHFGAHAPKAYSAASTSCGAYADNGSWYGKGGLWLYDDTNLWQAGRGTTAGGNCIGIKLVSWSANTVVFNFGNAYNSFGTWIANPGDNFVLDVKGFYWGGTISYIG